MEGIAEKRERRVEGRFLTMVMGTETVLHGQVEAAAKAAGLVVVSTEPGTDFSGGATVRFTLALESDAKRTTPLDKRTTPLEMSAGFEFGPGRLEDELAVYLGETAKRLKNPRPECYLTMSGLPLSLGGFAWPFHASTSGADTFIVHGQVKLEDGKGSPLHAKVSASMTVTFKEIVAAMEQPFAEGVIYNAVRKTMDQGQLELVKSGNRQPVPVTTRYYRARAREFVFNDTTDAQRQEYVAAKVYWLSGVLGGGEPVWLLDPRDAQYLNTTVAELRRCAEAIAGEGLIRLAGDWAGNPAAKAQAGEFGTPSEALMGHKEQYEAEMADALAFIRPTFNEEMRGGHTNM